MIHPEIEGGKFDHGGNVQVIEKEYIITFEFSCQVRLAKCEYIADNLHYALNLNLSELVNIGTFNG